MLPEPGVYHRCRSLLSSQSHIRMRRSSMRSMQVPAERALIWNSPLLSGTKVHCWRRSLLGGNISSVVLALSGLKAIVAFAIARKTAVTVHHAKLLVFVGLLLPHVALFPIQLNAKGIAQAQARGYHLRNAIEEHAVAVLVFCLGFCCDVLVSYHISYIPAVGSCCQNSKLPYLYGWLVEIVV
jgi:hypothetical protein